MTSTSKFLILEDEPLIAMDLEFAFEDVGYSSVTAINNAEAKANMDEHGITAAILDVNLGSGETCEPTAKELKRRGIPFILHTGDLNRVGERLRALNVPVASKPILADRLVDMLLELANRKIAE